MNLVVGTLMRLSMLRQTRNQAHRHSALLHHSQQMVLRAIQNCNILQRIGVQDENIGKGAWADNADLTRHSKHLGGVGRAVLQDCRGRKDFGSYGEFFGLQGVHRYQQVGPATTQNNCQTS